MHGEERGFPRGIAAHVALQTLRDFLAGAGGAYIDLAVLVTPVGWRGPRPRAVPSGHPGSALVLRGDGFRFAHPRPRASLADRVDGTGGDAERHGRGSGVSCASRRRDSGGGGSPIASHDNSEFITLQFLRPARPARGHRAVSARAVKAPPPRGKRSGHPSRAPRRDPSPRDNPPSAPPRAGSEIAGPGLDLRLLPAVKARQRRRSSPPPPPRFPSLFVPPCALCCAPCPPLLRPSCRQAGAAFAAPGSAPPPWPAAYRRRARRRRHRARRTLRSSRPRRRSTFPATPRCSPPPIPLSPPDAPCLSFSPPEFPCPRAN